MQGLLFESQIHRQDQVISCRNGFNMDVKEVVHFVWRCGWIIVMSFDYLSYVKKNVVICSDGDLVVSVEGWDWKRW